MLKKMKKKYWRIIVFISSVFFISGMTWSCFFADREIAENYFEKYKIHLEGKVTGKVRIGKGCDLIFLEVFKCNYKSHDVRDSSQSYMLVIKDSIAELVYQNYKDEMSINDKVMIDFPARKMQGYTGPNLNFEHKLEGKLVSEFYFGQLSAHHKL